MKPCCRATVVTLRLFVGTQKLLPHKPEPNLPQIGIRRRVAPLAEASLQRTETHPQMGGHVRHSDGRVGVVGHETLRAPHDAWDGRRRILGQLVAVVVRMMMQKERQQIFIERRLCGRPQREDTLSAAPQIRQRPAPDLLQIIGERVQRKPQRLFEGVPEPARTLRFQLIGIQAKRSLKKRPVEPQLGIEVGRERHGLALAPFRRAMPLGCGRGAARAMHHQKQA